MKNLEKKETKKVLWFSRHEMTADQRAALGDCEITQVNRTIKRADELAEEIAAADIIAVVAPPDLLSQFLRLAGDKPVIKAKSNRVPNPTGDGEVFRFEKWERVLEVKIVTEDFVLE